MYREYFSQYDERFRLDEWSPSSNLGDFQCSDDDYRLWITDDAAALTDANITQVHLLRERDGGEVVAYMALLTDAYIISESEREMVEEAIGFPVRFTSLPALKIGKLAINAKYEKQGIGRYLLWLAIGTAESLNHSGIACRFLTVDADVTVDPSTPEFYRKCGFVLNSHRLYRRDRYKSMRCDINVVSG